MGFADKVITVAEDPGPWKLYLYGPFGVGKTVLACQAPKPFLIDTENSRRSLLNHPELVGIPIRPVKKWEQMEEIAFALVDKDPFFDDIETIIIDTFTEIQKRELREEVKEAYDRSNGKRHPYLPSQNEYNINNTKLWVWLIEMIERSGKNLILTAHVREEKDEQGTTVLIRPANSPVTMANVAGLVDAVFYMTAQGKADGMVRKLQTVPIGNKVAKSRFGNLPAIIENPHFDMIMKAAEEQRQYALDLLAKTQDNGEADSSKNDLLNLG